MAYANDIQTAANAGHRPLSGFFRSVQERFARYRVYRETMLELSGLSDRELADLGISRATIKAVSYEAAYGA